MYIRLKVNQPLPVKSLFTLLSGILAYSASAFAQDTTYLYFDKGWQECKKDTAYYYGIVYKNGDLWSRKDFWVKGNQLQMEATYLDQACKTGHGTFKWYRENGNCWGKAVNLKL